jgi:hypothetical protein
MESADYILFFAIVIGGLLVALLPFLVALGIASLGSLPRSFTFAALCALLTYGATVAAFVAQAPLLAASTHLAPTWASLGHHTLANAVAYSAEYLGYATVLVPAVLMFVWPLWLRKRWAAVLTALGANNSFKPKPLRGSA